MTKKKNKWQPRSESNQNQSRPNSVALKITGANPKSSKSSPQPAVGAASDDAPPAYPVIPPPNEEKTRIEIRHMKREIKKMAAELADLEWKNSRYTRIGLTKASEWASLITTCVAILSVIAVFATGYINNASKVNENAAILAKIERKELESDNRILADRQKEYERNIAKLAVDKAEAEREKKEIEDVLRPLRGEIEAGKKLASLLRVGIMVQLNRAFGLDQATSVVIGTPDGVFVDKDMKEEDVVSALKAVDDLPAVHSLTFSAINVTDDLLRNIPKALSDLTFESCEFECDLGLLAERPRLSSVSISRGKTNFTVSGPLNGVRHLSVANLQSMDGLPRKLAKAFPSAVYVEFEHLPLTDADVEELKPMAAMSRVSLFNTKVTSRCIDTLKTFPSVQAIGLLPEISKQGWIPEAKCYVSNLRLTFAAGKQLGAAENEQSRREAKAE